MTSCYVISRDASGKLHLLFQKLIKGKLDEEEHIDDFDIGNSSDGTKRLAGSIMRHYFGTDPGGLAEAERRADLFLYAYLAHAIIPVGGKYEISGDVIEKLFSL